ncbi:MAG: methyltransferase domain-containing protein [Gemmatimonadaceae bacterium]
MSARCGATSSAIWPENLNFFQVNLFDLPFREGVFDFIYSLGVLHHTPDCEKAFKGLVRHHGKQDAINGARVVERKYVWIK